jgi:hypothetical protein
MAGGREVPKYIALSIKKDGVYHTQFGTGFDQQPVCSPHLGVTCVDVDGGVFLNRINHRGEALPGGTIEICCANKYLWSDIVVARKSHIIFPPVSREFCKPRENGFDRQTLTDQIFIENNNRHFLIYFNKAWASCDLRVFDTEGDYLRKHPVLEARLTLLSGRKSQEIIDLARQESIRYKNFFVQNGGNDIC